MCSPVKLNAQNALPWHEYSCLIHVAHPLSQAIPDLHEALLQFIDVMKLMSVANVSMHASMPKDDILAFNTTQEYTYNQVNLVNFVNSKAKR